MGVRREPGGLKGIMVLSVLGACPAQSPLSQLQDVLFERAHETPIRQPVSTERPPWRAQWGGRASVRSGLGVGTDRRMGVCDRVSGQSPA